MVALDTAVLGTHIMDLPPTTPSDLDLPTQMSLQLVDLQQHALPQIFKFVVSRETFRLKKMVSSTFR
jgi:hypothetical protein